MNRFLPWLALLATIIIWAGYLVATRAAMNADVTPVDVGLLRSVPAAMLLLPFTLRHGLRPQGTELKHIFAIAGLGGTLFVLLISTGLQFAPVADSGIFTPSMMPVFAAVFAYLAFRNAQTRSQILGYALIVFGALAIGGYEAMSDASSGAWRGHILFLCAASMWAIYTLVFKNSGLSAMAGTTVMVTWSSFAFLLLLPFFGSKLLDISGGLFAILLAQGIASGLVANLTYLYAVRAMGHVIPAAAAALVPVLTALGGWVFLGESMTIAKAIGIAVVASGVLLASGLLDSKTRS